MSIRSIFCIVQLFLSSIIIAQINPPSSSDYDAYGTRFTANDFLIVRAQNIDQSGSIFSIQFYNLCPLLSCKVQLNDSSIYIYTVSIGMNQTIQQQYFAFNAYKNDPNTYTQTAYIGMVSNTVFNSCNFTITYTAINSQYNLGNYYVMTVDPKGLIAYGFAFEFLVLYNLYTQQEIDWDSGFYDYYYNAYYTSAPRFMPHAIAATKDYIILAGVISEYSLGRWVPTVYLIDVRNCSTYMSSSCMPSWSLWPTWTYNLVPYSWEMYGADNDYYDYYDSYQPLYSLSVDINPNINEVLLGIQYFSTVIRLSIDSINFSSIIYIDKRATSQTYVGYGKSVKYAMDGSIIILANVYSYDYNTWYSSSIETYANYQNFNDTNVIPILTFPNNIQLLWTPPLNPSLLAIHLTSVALLFLDFDGNVYVLLASPTGYYTNSNSGTGENNIYFSSKLTCQPGTYKTDISIDWCRLCPQGTFNSGNMSSKCAPCTNTTSFCPLGSLNDTSIAFMSRQTQIRAYPESPENIIFDDILILNMFSLNTKNQHCLLISPLFWTLIIFLLTITIIVFMGLLKISMKCKSIRNLLKKIFRFMDLIGEGELWIGGLVSLSILVLCIFAYTFSNSYLNQYPIENVGDSSFACDQSLRNAKFSSNLQLTATVDTSDEKQELFDLINQQIFTLHVQFVNSLFQCSDLQIFETNEFLTSNALFQCSFNGNNSIMSVDVNLTAQLVTIEFLISSSATAGGLTIGLTGPNLSSNDDDFVIQELNFQEPFTIDNQTLRQSSTIEIQLIKVVNITKSLQGSDDKEYSGLYIPSFIYDLNQMFYNEENFDLYHRLSQTSLNIKITNSPYYIQNIQEPIARQSEIIFHNLLFTIVCMEIFGLVFLIFKLIVLPILKFLLKKIATKSNRVDILNEDFDEDNDQQMKERLVAYVKKLEEKEKMNQLELNNTNLKSIVVVPDRTASSKKQTATNTMQFDSIEKPWYFK